MKRAIHCPWHTCYFDTCSATLDQREGWSTREGERLNPRALKLQTVDAIWAPRRRQCLSHCSCAEPGHLGAHWRRLGAQETSTVWNSWVWLSILMWAWDPVVAPIPPKPLHFLQENYKNDWYECVLKWYEHNQCAFQGLEASPWLKNDTDSVLVIRN